MPDQFSFTGHKISEQEAELVTELGNRIYSFCINATKSGIAAGTVGNALFSAFLNFIIRENMEHEIVSILPNVAEHLLEKGAEKMENIEKH